VAAAHRVHLRDPTVATELDGWIDALQRLV
jgi:hypothetical protein